MNANPQQHGGPAAVHVAPVVNIGRLLRLRARLLVTVAAGLAVPGIIAAAILLPREYRSVAEFRFLAIAPTVIEDQPGAFQPGNYDTFVNTQVGLLGGPAILKRAIEDQRVKDLPEIRSVAAPLPYIRSRISSSTAIRNELVTVDCVMRTPEAAHTVLAAVVESFEAYNKEQDITSGGDRAAALTTEQETLQKRLDEEVARLTELQGQTNAFLESEGDLYRAKLLEAQEERVRAESDLDTLRTQADQLVLLQQSISASPDSPIYEFGIQAAVDASQEIILVRQALVQAETELEEMQHLYLDGVPQIRAAQRNVESLQTRLRGAETTKRFEILQRMIPDKAEEIAEKEAAIVEADERVSRYQAMVDEHSERVKVNGELSARIVEQQGKIQDVRDKIAAIQDQLTNIQIESRAPARIQLVAPPTVPDGADFGRLRRAVILILGLALATSVGVAILAETRDQKIYTEQDIHSITRVPVLSSIPMADFDPELQGTPAARIVLDKPHSAIAEEIQRTVVQLLHLANRGDGLHTLLFASPASGDGCTAVLCNVGLALAQAGRRVLIVDLNCHKPGIEAALGMSIAKGVWDAIADPPSSDRYVRQTSVQDLAVIGPGSDPGALALQLSAAPLHQFLSDLEGQFDHILIDTPPALLISDAKRLAPIADGVVLVLGSGITNLGMARRCLREIEGADGDIVGIILNLVRPLRGGYLVKRLGEFYAYKSAPRHSGVLDLEIVSDDSPSRD